MPPPLIDDLTSSQAEREATLRAQLEDLAQLRAPEGRTVEYVSRRPDDGRLHIRLDDGEIIYVSSEAVDAYVRRHKPTAATLAQHRERLSADMFHRGKVYVSLKLARPLVTATIATRPVARESHATSRGHRRPRQTRAGPDDDPAPPPAAKPRHISAILAEYLRKLRGER
jgi:hypothetical protein